MGDVLGFLILRTCDTSIVKGPDRLDNAGLEADPGDILRNPSSTGSISTDMMAAGRVVAVDGALRMHEGDCTEGIPQLDARGTDARSVSEALKRLFGVCLTRRKEA